MSERVMLKCWWAGDLVVERGAGNMWGRIRTAGSGREFFSSCEKFSKTPSCYIYFYIMKYKVYVRSSEHWPLS